MQYELSNNITNNNNKNNNLSNYFKYIKALVLIFYFVYAKYPNFKYIKLYTYCTQNIFVFNNLKILIKYKDKTLIITNTAFCTSNLYISNLLIPKEYRYNYKNLNFPDTQQGHINIPSK